MLIDFTEYGEDNNVLVQEILTSKSLLDVPTVEGYFYGKDDDDDDIDDDDVDGIDED